MGAIIIIVAAEARAVEAVAVATGVRAEGEIIVIAVAAEARRVGKGIVAVVAVEGAREGEGIIVVAVKRAQVGEGIIVIAKKGVRVGEGIANVVTATAAAAARVRDLRPSPHVDLPVAPLSLMIATPVTAHPSPPWVCQRHP